MADTRTRLREERRRSFRGVMVPMLFALVIGYLLGFSGTQGTAEGLGAAWAWTLVAFGLGMVVGLLGQRFIRSDADSKTVTESEQANRG